MAIHTLASLGLRGFKLPDRDMVVRTLSPTDERCPNCKKHRNATDFVYIVLPEYAVQECCCYHCLPSTDTAASLGVGTCLLASERYIDDKVSQCVLEKMLLTSFSRKRDIPVREWLELGIADAVARNWGEGCTGRWSRIISATGFPLDTYLPCCDENRATRNRYWTRNGLVCAKCLTSSSTMEWDIKQGGRRNLRPEIKQRMRLICEGVRHAIWLASLERYVPGIVQAGDISDRTTAWGVDWIDWLRGTPDTTNQWETDPLTEFKRYRFT